MEWNIESIIFYLLLLDAVGANMLAWSGGQLWWQRHANMLARAFPLSRGWASYYLVLVLVMGWMLARGDLLATPF